MYLKACVPAGVMGIVAFIVAINLEDLGKNPVFYGLAGWAPWVALAGAITALLLIAASIWRMWRWEQGEGPTCRRCGGPLGREIDGRYGPYRRCLACDYSASARHYC
jgi:hypothetical protein